MVLLTNIACVMSQNVTNFVTCHKMLQILLQNTPETIGTFVYAFFEILGCPERLGKVFRFFSRFHLAKASLCMSQNVTNFVTCHKFCYRTLQKLSERLYMHFLDPRKSQNVSGFMISPKIHSKSLMFTSFTGPLSGPVRLSEW